MNSNIIHLIDARTRQDMLDQMLAVRDAKERVISVGPAPAYRRLAEANVESLHCPMGVKGFAWRRLAKRLPAGVIVHAWSRALLSIATEAARRVDGGVVYSLPHLPSGKVLSQMPWEVGQYRHCLTVPTARARKELVRLRADAKRVFVLSPAVREIPETPSRESVRERLGYSPEEVVILAPAEMLRGAGHDWVCWAHAICREVQDRGRLILPGHHPRQPRARYFANTTGFGREVKFTGETYTREELLVAADITAFLYDKDLGLTAMVEAMTAGPALLASATPDVASVCEDEATALLTDPGSPRSAAAAMLRLIEDPELRRRLGKAGQTYAREHFPRAVARGQLERIYAIFAT